MPYPQLTGRPALAHERPSGRPVLLAVVVLAAALGLLAWRLLPQRTSESAEAATALAVSRPTSPPPEQGPTEDQRLYLEHAEQALVSAAEQLTAARRLLAGLSPALGRSYLQYEKRRADSAWTACDAAARAIEQARDDIKVVVATERKYPMVRTPHRALESSASATNLVSHAARLRETPANRLGRALAKTPTPFQVIGVGLPTVALPGQLELPPLRRRTPAHVPGLPAPRRFPVASMDLSRKDVALPYGVGRHVNAATVKAIAGGRRSDRLLKKTPAGWEFVPNETLIDLTDNTQEFRLGRLTIFS